jgi:hypothetical protein
MARSEMERHRKKVVNYMPSAFSDYCCNTQYPVNRSQISGYLKSAFTMKIKYFRTLMHFLFYRICILFRVRNCHLCREINSNHNHNEREDLS